MCNHELSIKVSSVIITAMRVFALAVVKIIQFGKLISLHPFKLTSIPQYHRNYPHRKQIN